MLPSYFVTSKRHNITRYRSFVKIIGRFCKFHHKLEAEKTSSKSIEIQSASEMKTNTNKRLDAYTLTEILIVLAIIGILILLALPNLMPLITKAKTTEAKMQLEHIAKLEQSYFYEHSKFSQDLIEIGFIQEKLTSDGKDGKANYKVEVIAASPTTFTAKATAVTDFDGDGTYNVWQIDQDKNLKEVVAD